MDWTPYILATVILCLGAGAVLVSGLVATILQKMRD